MGNSRKYPYTTTDGVLEFRGKGGFFELEFRGQGWGGGFFELDSEGIGEYLHLEFWRLKMLILWTLPVTSSAASEHSQIKNAVIYACFFIFSEMNLNRGTANDNFKKKVDALTEEGMA